MTTNKRIVVNEWHPAASLNILIAFYLCSEKVLTNKTAAPHPFHFTITSPVRHLVSSYDFEPLSRISMDSDWQIGIDEVVTLNFTSPTREELARFNNSIDEYRYEVSSSSLYCPQMQRSQQTMSSLLGRDCVKAIRRRIREDRGSRVAFRVRSNTLPIKSTLTISTKELYQQLKTDFESAKDVRLFLYRFAFLMLPYYSHLFSLENAM